MKRLVPVGTAVSSAMIFLKASIQKIPHTPNITLESRAVNLFMAINKDKPQVSTAWPEKRVIGFCRMKKKMGKFSKIISVSQCQQNRW